MIDLSMDIIIPVLNEQDRLADGINETLDFISKSNIKSYYITIADNGSTDKTEIIARALVDENPKILRYIKVGKKGVGLALRTAWAQSDKDIVGYMDVDLATDLRHLKEVCQVFNNTDAEIVNGSRLLSDSEVKNRTILREITSRSFNFLVKKLLQTKISDGMCGFKFLKRSAFNRLLNYKIDTDGWFFCTEILVKADWLGMKIQEIPVKWTDDSDSRVNIASLSCAYLQEIIRLRKERTSIV